MQKWEYMTVIVWDDRPAKVNGVEIPKLERASHISVYLDKLGDEGWEICGVIRTSPTGESCRLFLKRPKP
jgi:hypothetical protein